MATSSASAAAQAPVSRSAASTTFQRSALLEAALWRPGPACAMGADEPMLCPDEESQLAVTFRVPHGLRVQNNEKILRVVLLAAAAMLAGGIATAALGTRPATRLDRAAINDAESLAVLMSVARHCVVIAGVKVAEGLDPKDRPLDYRLLGTPKSAPSEETMSTWKPCAPKWSANCLDTGCCSDWGMQCHMKNKNWAACMSTCNQKEQNGENWTCQVVTPPTPRTSEACTESCRKRGDCQQAIFTSDGGGSCLLSTELHTKVVWAGDNFNTSFCGNHNQRIELLAERVREQLPFKLDPLPLVNCSWGGEDCSQTKCCNDVQCDKNFQGCSGYSCYKKSPYFSGCVLGAPPSDWNGTWLGGPREHRSIPPAGTQVAVQGSSLYCFSVVNWAAGKPKPFWDNETALAKNMEAKRGGIFQCDAHDFFDGVPTPVAEWGSFSNIDAFQQIWQKVKERGSWKVHDWTVKTDVDSMFIAKRLKDHLYNLRTPRGSRVYLENTWYKFKFMGALEILTREALEVFLALGHTCIRGAHDGGEDFFMRSCMDGLGIDHQSDFDLLRDRYAAQNGPCTDGWKVAYHYMKTVADWNQCYTEAMR